RDATARPRETCSSPRPGLFDAGADRRSGSCSCIGITEPAASPRGLAVCASSARARSVRRPLAPSRDGVGFRGVITGVHVIIFTRDAEADRTFFRDILEFPSVDAGGGWLIFALPPAELAAHPADGGGHHELYLMCDDVRKTVEELKARGVDFSG